MRQNKAKQTNKQTNKQNKQGKTKRNKIEKAITCYTKLEFLLHELKPSIPLI